MKKPPEHYNAGVRRLAERLKRSAVAEGLRVDPRGVSAYLRDAEYLTKLETRQAGFFAENGVWDLRTIRGGRAVGGIAESADSRRPS